MNVTISREDDDLVTVDAEGGLLDALVELMDPQRFSSEGVKTVKKRRVAGADVDAVARNRGAAAVPQRSARIENVRIYFLVKTIA